MPDLSERHQALIDASGILPEIAEVRGYRTVTKRVELNVLGFSASQANVPALLVPVWNILGEIGCYQARPDMPRVNKGHSVKYETPHGTKVVLDIHPSMRRALSDPGVPLWITEGIRKADAATSKGLCCIGLMGVWNWRGRNEQDGLTALPDWESIAIKGRQCYIVFDSDVMLKREVYAALRRLKSFIEHRGAKVAMMYLPAGDGGRKMGLDDYLAGGHGLKQLLRLATDELIEPVVPEKATTLYDVTADGFVWNQTTPDGGIARRQLTNFRAFITGDVVHDDGVETFRRYEIDAALNGWHASFVVPCEQFPRLNWADEHLGPGAVVYAGHGFKDHTCVAIRLLSDEVEKKRTFGHTGWREVDGEWIFLHAGGAIGANGVVPGVEVVLPPGLARFILPAPPKGAALKEAIQASLEVLKVVNEPVSVPLLAAIYRAVIGGSDFSEHLAGPTGVGKSELCAVVQQHFGAGMDRQHLPASWSSTGNALEALAFSAKDCILVVDDFAPTGNPGDVLRYHREADRVLRAQGNDAGRQRMKRDSALQGAKPPRGIIVSSGEDIPRGQSLRARLLALEVANGEVDWEVLSCCQKCGREGLYAQAVSGFVQWLAPRYATARASIGRRIADLRTRAYSEGQHRRTPGIVADLAIGFREFLAFARESGVLTDEEDRQHWRSGWGALGSSGARQGEYHAAAEPATRFVSLLSAAIASGAAHVADRNGGAPDDPLTWGWRKAEVGTGEFTRTEWRPQGRRVGWEDEGELYLEPDASFAIVQEIGQKTGDALAVTPQTLRKRLHEKGLLAGVDETRGKLLVRKTIEHSRQDVIHLKGAVIRPSGDDLESELAQ